MKHKLHLLRLKLFSKRTLFSTLTALLVIVTIGGLFLFNPWNTTTQAAWFNDSWTYRKAIVVTHSSDFTDRFVHLNVDTTDAPDKFQSDCGDVRFTNQNGDILDYYYNTAGDQCDNAGTDFYVNLTTILDGEIVIYMYYGNPSVVNGYLEGDFQGADVVVDDIAFDSEEKGPSPIAYWKFDEGQGTTAEDSTSNNIEATLGASTAAPAWQKEELCISGRCLLFDGSNDYVDTAAASPLDISSSAHISMSVWVKFSSKSVTGGSYWTPMILTETGQGDSTYDKGIRIDTSGRANFYVYDGATKYATGTTDLSDNNWHQITGTFDGSDIRVYVDGKLQGTTAASGSYNFTSPQVVFSFHPGTNNWYPGFLDEAKIYGTALSDNQVLTNYNARSNPEGVATVMGVNTQNNKALSDGLVGYWMMDESATPSLDSSGNNHSGTWNNNVAASSGKFGNSVSFPDATDDYIQITRTSALEPTNAISVAAWVNASTQSNFARIISHGTTTAGYELIMQTSGAGSKIEFNLGINSSEYNVVSNEGLADSNWHHVIGTWDGSTMRLYIDGVLQTNTQAISGTINHTVNDLRMGVQENSTSNDYAGKLDDVRIYSRALSPAEVSQLYNWAPGPVGYWKLDDKSGQTPIDVSGNANNGTLGASSSVSTDDPSWGNAKYGGGLTFDGTDDIVNVAHSSSLNVGSTISSHTSMIWAKVDDTNSPHQFPRLFSKGQNGWGAGQMPFTIVGQDSSGVLYINCTISDGTNSPNAGGTSVPAAAVSYRTWFHAACVRDVSADTLNLFLNGKLASSVTDTTTATTERSNLGLTFGCYAGGGCSGGGILKGGLDEAKVYNYARTQAQIIEDMNGGHPAPGSPVGSSVAYWKFDEGFGTNANDSTPNNNDLTLSTATSAWTNAAKFGKGWVGLGTNWVSRADDSDLDFEAVDDGTFSLWFKSTSATNPGATEYLISKGPGATVAGYAIYANTSGQICFGVDDDTTFGPDDSSCSTADIYDGTFHHISAVKTGTTSIQLFVDGKAQTADSSISATGTLANSSVFYVGDFNGSDNGNEFNGTLDEIKVYRSALSLSQINLDLNQSSAQVVGSLSSTQSAPNAASSLYCIPGDATACTGPVGEWNMDEGSGSTANDSSGNENSCSGVSTWVNGKVNKAVSFDTTVRLSCGSGSSVDNLGPLTAEAWIYPRTMGEFNYGNIMNKGVNSAGWTLAMKGWGTNGLFFSKDLSGSDVERATADNSITLNTWNHIVVTWDGSTTGSNIHIYVNGKETGYTDTANGSGTNSDASNTLYIGETDGQNNGFDGLIDQVKLFNYVRTPAQVAWDYNRGLPIAHWEFDECQGTTIHDSSGNSLSGTWSGSGGGNTTVGTCNTAGTAWGDGAVGKKNYSIDFDGSDDSINFGNPTLLEPTGPIAISMWVKPASGALSSGEHAMIHNYDGGGTTAQYELAFMSGVLEFNYGASSSYVSYVPTPAVSFTAGNWYHIIFTHSGSNSTGYFYINGVKYNSTKTGSATIPTGGNGDTLVGASTYSGLLDDIKMFHYTLTDAQAKTLYNDNAAYKTGPVTGAP